eukprot:CAMPEP_0113580754 /NCGR_PEP_ID=MMETSP0015_2-20120614/30870_1 /TAXON_ID=2838 /ORGANISM="Odontella" /LENGTH=72 /DNA_ID=CAMNT_0000485021 /DNA_START=11 /DNA_END=226 /DNA_ORIENTATION=+ /assembly_acc=CAM_ASM_000160
MTAFAPSSSPSMTPSTASIRVLSHDGHGGHDSVWSRDERSLRTLGVPDLRGSGSRSPGGTIDSLGGIGFLRG